MLYEKELQALGLSEKEAKVYLAALVLGPDTVQNIAKKAGINRPTAYLQIESLKEKGIISEVEKDKKILLAGTHFLRHGCRDFEAWEQSKQSRHLAIQKKLHKPRGPRL